MSETIEYENLILNELRAVWSRFIYKFKWTQYSLAAPNFRIMDAASRWGQWTSDTREMSFSRSFVFKHSWNEVLEVLKHEMAHQFVSEVLHLDNEAPHGPTFMQVCKQYGIDAAAHGVPGANNVTTTNHIVEKIRHLLKLAENDNNEAEAKNAAEAAHSMMLKYNIEVQAKNEEKGYTVRYLGGIAGRIQGYMSELANLLSKYYFVETIWISSRDPRTKKDGHELEISGTIENVEVAEYVHAFLSRAAVESWEKKFADPAFKLRLHEDFARSFGRGAFSTPRGFTISARTNFLLGFVEGFRAQLQDALFKEVESGLVLARDTGLESFYHNRHPSTRQLARTGGQYNPTMRMSGFSEGNSLKIPAAAKANKQSIPLLGK